MEENNIKEFLQDVHFIAPDGYTIDYFVLPTSEDSEIDEIVPDHPFFDTKVNPQKNTTAVFLKKPLEELESNPLITQSFIEVPNQYPSTGYQNAEWLVNKNITQGGGKVMAGDRIFKPINESYSQKTIILKERIGKFPKNTLFCFKRG